MLELVRPAIREVSDEIAGNCEANIGCRRRSGPVEVTDTGPWLHGGDDGPFATWSEGAELVTDCAVAPPSRRPVSRFEEI